MEKPFYTYKVRIFHNQGRVTITTRAQSESDARAIICKSEGCPESAIKAVSLVPITPAELKRHVENRGTESHFFTHSTMKFHGDSMRNYGVCAASLTDYDGNIFEVWELYRRRPVKHGVQSSAYFDRETFERRYPVYNLKV